VALAEFGDAAKGISKAASVAIVSHRKTTARASATKYRRMTREALLEVRRSRILHPLLCFRFRVRVRVLHLV
jgi:hypothetical protein